MNPNLMMRVCVRMCMSNFRTKIVRGSFSQVVNMPLIKDIWKKYMEKQSNEENEWNYVTISTHQAL